MNKTDANKYFILLSFHLFILALALGGLIKFEEFTDITFAAFLSGIFTDVPEGIFNSYNMLLGWSPLLESLQKLFSGVPIYGIMMLMLSAVCCWHFFIILQWGFHERIRPMKRIYYYMFLFLLISPHIFLVQITTLAILLQGSIVILVLLKLKSTEYERLPGWGYVTIALLAFSALRFESMLLLIILFAPFLLLFSGLHWSGAKQVLVLICAGIAIFFAAILGAKGWNPDDIRYKEIRPFKVAVWDQHADKQSQVSYSRADSAKVRAFKSLLIADTDSISLESLEHLELSKIDKDFTLMLASLKPWRVGLPAAFSNCFVSFKVMGFQGPALLLIIIFLVIQSRQLGKRKLFYLLATQFWLLCGVFGLSYIIKMESRFLAPVLILNIVSIFIFTLNGRAIKKQQFLRSMALLLCISFFLLALFYRKLSYVVDQGKAAGKITAFLNQVQESQPENIMWNYQSSAFLFNGPLYKSEIKPDVNNMTLDFGYLCYYQSYQNRMKRITGKQYFFDQFRFLCSQRTVWISTEDRMVLLQRYVLDVYGFRTNLIISATDSVSIYVNYTPLVFYAYKLAPE